MLADFPECVDWKKLSSYKKLPLEFVERHLDAAWDGTELSANPIITPDFVRKHIQYVGNLWCFRGMSRNPSITEAFVIEFLDQLWDWNLLSTNPAITPEFIKKSLPCHWPCEPYEALSKNPSVTLEFIETHSEKEWDWAELSTHPALTADYVQRHLYKPWDWTTLVNRFQIRLK